MFHFMFDGFLGYRSRLDDLPLVQEVLQEIPIALDLEPVMPAFLLPYYNGVDPVDCGISAFVFLRGGHLTIHTFSFRETYFMDLVAPVEFRTDRLESMLHAAFPCREFDSCLATRGDRGFFPSEPDPQLDFGPHLLIEIAGYRGPQTMDDLFVLFDALPERIGLTPIMRPYALRERDRDGGEILSIMTMIAESHISIHVFPERGLAYLDLFSCSFFDTEPVLRDLYRQFPGDSHDLTYISRGKRFHELKTDLNSEVQRARAWAKPRD